MPIKGFIGPEPVSTPVEYKRLRATGGELPDDLLREASSRLGITALLVAALWVIGDTAGHLAARAMLHDSRWLKIDISDYMTVLSITVSLALYAFIRSGTRNPRLVLNLGLVYLVAISLALALMWHWQDVPADYHFEIRPEISWVAVLILIFAAMLAFS